MKENDIGSNTRAIDLHTLPVDVYARTTNGRDLLSGNINFFPQLRLLRQTILALETIAQP